jgi:hypothetical protein
MWFWQRIWGDQLTDHVRNVVLEKDRGDQLTDHVRNVVLEKDTDQLTDNVRNAEALQK